MKLKYKINTILKYNNELKESPNIDYIESILLGNKCLCITNSKNVFIFNKIFRLIQKIDLSVRIFPKNMIPILNYPNLFALQEDNFVHIYEVQLKKKKEKVKLKRRVAKPKNYLNKTFYMYSLSCADILYFFVDNFFIYNIKNESFTYKKFSLTGKKYKESQYYIQIIKILEYKKNELIILLREFLYGEEDLNYNCEVNIRNSIVLFDLENSVVKKIYITNEDSGEYNTYMCSYRFDTFGDKTFSNDQNIFIINNSIVYIKDHRKDYGETFNYSFYIINILNGDIKYKFEDTITSKSFQFLFLFYRFQKSIYLCDNIFLFNGYELVVKKNEIEQNKIDIIYGTNDDDYKNNMYCYIKLKKNLFLLYNSHEIKICEFH